MSAGSTDKVLLTSENCGVVFIDHQPQMFAAIGKLARADLLKNVQVLASAAKLAKFCQAPVGMRQRAAHGRPTHRAARWDAGNRMTGPGRVPP